MPRSLLVREELVAAPRTSLNQPIGATRRIVAVHAEREQLEAIRAGGRGRPARR